ncbi:MAG: GDSL-type esterase/lipase family protein [Nitrospirota bacterium]
MKFRILKSNEVDKGEYYRKISLYHSVIDKNVPADSVIFIGDSHIQMLTVSAVADKPVNYGISGDTTAGILQRLPLYDSIRRSRAVVIAAGHNDIAQRANKGEIIRNYKLILEKIPADIPLFFNAVFPVDERAGTKFTGINSEIKSLNTLSERLCGEFHNCHFLNVREKLADETGNLAVNYHDGKGIHLNANGYSVWIGYLKEALHKFPKTLPKTNLR